MKVLIYGHGWSGQSALSLFDGLGFDCYVVDEKLDIGTILDARFITLKEALEQSFDLVLVCIVNKQSAYEVLKKLEKQGIPTSKIRLFQTYQYREKMSKMLRHFFGSAKEVLQDCLSESLTMPLLHSKILALENAYFKNKRDSTKSLAQWGQGVRKKFPNQSIFSMLYSTSMIQRSIAHIAYPAFNIVPSQDKTEDKNFYFIQEVDFESLKNRPKDVKLVACFGNSALRVEYLPLENTITHYLQQHLKNEKFIVVNFGISGYTVYEQLMLYNALIYPLKPEIVLSFVAGTDFRIGYVCCDFLVKKHNVIYSPYFDEKSYKAFVSSDLPLHCEDMTSQKVNSAIADEDIIQAILARLEQFHSQIVRGGGGVFFAFIQPLLPCKLEWSEEEKDMRAKEKEQLSNVANYQNTIIDTLVPKLVDDLKQQIQANAYDFVFDLNQVIRDSKEALFTNHWIHCNARGNQMCAEYVYKTLQQRGIIK